MVFLKNTFQLTVIWVFGLGSPFSTLFGTSAAGITELTVRHLPNTKQ